MAQEQSVLTEDDLAPLKEREEEDEIEVLDERGRTECVSSEPCGNTVLYNALICSDCLDELRSRDALE